MIHYNFSIMLSGDGETPDEAWQDAVESFMLDPGDCPDEREIIRESDEESVT